MGNAQVLSEAGAAVVERFEPQNEALIAESARESTRSRYALPRRRGGRPWTPPRAPR